MKSIFIFIPSLVFILCACSNDKQNSNNTTETHTSLFEDENSVTSLNKSYKAKIKGLWKLYKSTTHDGQSNIEEGNKFIEIKDNMSFEENDHKGAWYLSFAPDTANNIVALFTKVRSNSYYQDEAVINTFRLECVTENNTNYLKLTDFKDGMQLYYIRQQ
ncbi:MAG: hypothetical protein JST26_19810 [Bacteroidetes bacterium]|nr:hypothetical protein [Bacteroidota bacterium]